MTEQTNPAVAVKKSLILKDASGKDVVVSEFQRTLFNSITKGEVSLRQLNDKLTNALRAVLVDQYGDVPPTLEAYRADLHAIKAQALKAKVSDAYALRVYSEAVQSIYGATLESEQKDIAFGANAKLPLSKDTASVAKRKVRFEASAAKTETPANKSDDKSKHAQGVSENNAIEQYIAKVGIGKVLAACAHILASAKSTALQAKTIDALLKDLDRKEAKSA